MQSKQGPFLYDDNDEIIGVRNGNGREYLLVQSLKDQQTPANGTSAYVQAEWTVAGVAIVYEAVNTGRSGNKINVVHVATVTHAKTPTITVKANDTDGTVLIVVTGRNNSTTVDDIATAILADEVASQYITATAVQADIKMASLYNFTLANGTDATPGPIGCLAYSADNTTVYRKTDSQTWTAIASAPV